MESCGDAADMATTTAAPTVTVIRLPAPCTHVFPETWKVSRDREDSWRCCQICGYRQVRGLGDAPPVE